MMSPEALARVTLNHVAEPGDPRMGALVHQLGPETVVGLLRKGDLNIGSEQQAHRLNQVDPIGILEDAERRGIRFVTPDDDEWPHQLNDLADCSTLMERGGLPVGLWVKGDLHLAETAQEAVAVVGARSATSYGIHQAQTFGNELATAGKAVVSGAAYGVDQAAHRGALAANGRTIAVLGCGADRAYPAAHADLLNTIAKRGLVVSESPPDASPTRTRFLARNRLSAAMSNGTLLVEGAARSGSLNTAQWSAELGRQVMAMPGPVSSAASAGVHQLIRAGQASLVTSSHDVLEDLATWSAGPDRNQPGSAEDESYVPSQVRGTSHRPTPGGLGIAHPSPPR